MKHLFYVLEWHEPHDSSSARGRGPHRTAAAAACTKPNGRGNYIIMGGGNGSGIIHCNMAVNVDSTVVGGPACARNAVRGAWNDTQVKQEHCLPRQSAHRK